MNADDFPVEHPHTVSEVVVTPGDCPLDAEQVEQLRKHLLISFEGQQNDMATRWNVWVKALEFCA